MNGTHRKSTFKMKALAVMIPVLVLISLVYTFIAIVSEKRLMRSEILKRAETITVLASQTGELPILSGNPELMKAAVTKVRSASDVSSVSFFDDRLKLLAHVGTPISGPLPRLAQDAPLSVFEEQEELVLYAPVLTVRTAEATDLLQGSSGAEEEVRERIGWVRLGFSKSSMHTVERQLVARGLVIAALFTTVTGILIVFLVRLVTRPLGAIVRAAQKIAQGDLSLDIAVKRTDELGSLAEAFRTMNQTIRRVLAETNALIVGVHEGRLETRGRPELFEGGWRELVLGMNDLTEAFAKVNEQAREARKRAEVANEAKSTFLANMSHELRTPLNAILGYAQILKRQENLTPAQRQQVETVRSSGNHLLMLINDILDVGKIEAKKMELEESTFALDALLQDVFEITQVKADEKDLRFKLERLSPLPEYVHGDERKLKQVLLNLLSNAVRYTRRGAVVLQASYALDRDAFRIEVVDTGIGIARDKLDSIFEPFTQVDSGAEPREGTGLGLTITKRLVALMGGTLGVKSEPARGSTFWVVLPLPVSPGIAVLPEVPERAIVGYSGERKSILIVDDNVPSTSFLVALLEPLGFEIATAGNGLEAIEKARSRPPDLVLMDLLMPEVDGLESARRMRQLSELARTKIIGLSATVSPGERKTAFQAACDDFLGKPVQVDLLLDAIRVLLGISWERKHEAPLAAATVDRAAAMEVPPLEEMKALYELALMGNMRRIRSWASEVEEKDPRRYGAFAAKLRKLADGFKTKAIVALVEGILQNAAGDP